MASMPSLCPDKRYLCHQVKVSFVQTDLSKTDPDGAPATLEGAKRLSAVGRGLADKTSVRIQLVCVLKLNGVCSDEGYKQVIIGLPIKFLSLAD